MYKYQCPNCKSEFTTAGQQPSVRCPYCGNTFQTAYGSQPSGQPSPGAASYGGGNSNDIFTPGPSGKSRGVAGLLAIFLGSLGVHYFYLGKTTPGLVFLLVSLLSCGTVAVIPAILSLIQGILMLSGTQADFEKKYDNPMVSFPMF